MDRSADLPLSFRPGFVAMALAALLLVAVSLLFIVPRLVFPSKSTKRAPLAVAIPAISGWQRASLPLADSPEASQVVAGILQFNDAIYLRYTKPGVQVYVYAAYWKPGQAPYGLVGVHTPDTCWVNSGWKQMERSHRQRRSVAGVPLKPLEEGIFQFQDETTEVIFWHLVGGEPYEDYGMTGWVGGLRGYLRRFPHLFQNFAHFGLNLAQEQYFVRISSDTPFAKLWSDPDFQRLMESLKPLGIFADGTESGK